MYFILNLYNSLFIRKIINQIILRRSIDKIVTNQLASLFYKPLTTHSVMKLVKLKARDFMLENLKVKILIKYNIKSLKIFRD